MVTISNSELEILLDCINLSLLTKPLTTKEERETLERIRERTKRAIARRDEKRAFEEEIKKAAIAYRDLIEGDLFRLTISKNDLRVFRRDKEGSTQIIDSFGSPSNYKSYPYLSMIVYKIDRR